MASKKIAGGKNRKHGRNKIWCDAYRKRGQREKNKAKKVLKHLAQHPNDNVAKEYINGRKISSP